MCGRFYLSATPAEIKKKFKVPKVPAITPRYNIAPTQMSPIVVAEGKGRGLHLARWGLVPPWSHDLSHGARMINARAETVEEKASYRKAFQSRRCLVPANGFYEWRHSGYAGYDGAKKQPYKIALRNGGLIAFAGLWERWQSETDLDDEAVRTIQTVRTVETFTIITTEANKAMSKVHDRMPVIIAPADYERWLSAPPATAKKLLVPYSRRLTLTPVSARVNSVRNDDVGLVAPT